MLLGKFSCDASYPAGGYSLELPFSEVFMVKPENKNGYIFEYDYTNKKVKVKYPTKSQVSDLALADHAAQAHAVTDTLAIAVGATSVTSTAANGDIIDGSIAVADHAALAHSFTGTHGTVDAGPAEEVAEATDLSALTDVRFLAFGW
jgi:hypothetical protein